MTRYSNISDSSPNKTLEPQILFVDVQVFFEHKWHLRCINCGMTPADWSISSAWQLLLSNGRSISVTRPPGSCDTAAFPMGPESVYGISPIIAAMDPRSAERALVAENSIVFVSEDDLSQVAFPQFLSVDQTRCDLKTYFVKFESPFLEDLPQVQNYDKRMRKYAEINPDWALFNPPPTKTRLPSGLRVPAKIGRGEDNIPVVFFVKEWRSDDEALVEFYISGSVEHCTNLYLRGGANEHSEFTIGWIQGGKEKSKVSGLFDDTH